MRGGGGHGSSATVPPSLPRWGIGPPPMGLSPLLPSTLSPLGRPGVDAFRATPKTYAPRFSPGLRVIDGRWDGRFDGPRRGWRRHDGSGKGGYPGAVYIGGSPYYYPGVVDPVVYPGEPPPQEEPEGFLRLLITPRHAGVFVDGIYEGTVDDFGGTGERALRAGLHAVRVAADGFEPVEFDVRVPVNDTITLRRDLDPRRAPPPPVPPPAAAPPAKPKTIYVIPRCYLGDSRPLPNQLPTGCSLADLRTLN